MSRWSPEQVAAAAPSTAALAAARPLATTGSWAKSGADDRALWGSCQGTSAEPYDTFVDHVEVRFACTCPSRRRPCKHALALLLLWCAHQIPEAAAPPAVQSWLARTARDTTAVGAVPSGPDGVATAPASPAPPESAAPTTSPETGDADTGIDDPPDPVPPESRDAARDERVERMRAGLDELDRWLDDRLRTGLADPSLAQYATWDELAARLVDARAGSLANRIRRLAGLVGASPEWHSEVLAELGILHLLAQAGRRLGDLPGALADGVATTVGWQVRQADVLAGVPDTDDWIVAGRSDTREDRIEVRRHWLRGTASGRWALLLSFAAYRQSLDTSLVVGSGLRADLHRYPGPALRALMGDRHGDWVLTARPPASDVVGACGEIGRMLVTEPWLDRVPFTVRATLTTTGSSWVLTDETGSLPVLLLAGSGPAGDRPMAVLLALSAGEPVDVTCEWTPHGVVPLTVHLDDRSIDIGPRADRSFVGAA
ncbi:MAG: SWIM zinc finger family protein [Ilumatobacteraceae bacterium]